MNLSWSLVSAGNGFLERIFLAGWNPNELLGDNEFESVTELFSAKHVLSWHNIIKEEMVQSKFWKYYYLHLEQSWMDALVVCLRLTAFEVLLQLKIVCMYSQTPCLFLYRFLMLQLYILVTSFFFPICFMLSYLDLIAWFVKVDRLLVFLQVSNAATLFWIHGFMHFALCYRCLITLIGL